MYLSGILADDMGLGKTLQAITSITQMHALHPGSTTMIICPTSLLYNWYEEFKNSILDLRLQSLMESRGSVNV